MIECAQLRWDPARRWLASRELDLRPQLALVFGGREALQAPEPIRALRELVGEVAVVGCSTAGEILDTEVSDERLVATLVEFERTRVAIAAEPSDGAERSAEAGRRLADRLAGPDLRHVFLLAEGIGVNGSELARGVATRLPGRISVTGGLAGDADRFASTLVRWGDRVSSEAIVGLGFYGEALQVGHGSLGGWDPFGPERRITRARGKVLFELDGRPALELYRRYLGDHADDLPASGLLFPLCVRPETGGEGVVRTIVGVDEGQGSLIFAGEIPEGQLARLMKANLDRLIDGATGAAERAIGELGGAAELVLLVSCVGRKMILKQRVEEEVESVRQVVGCQAALTGFYSYGEISPSAAAMPCELHNQTMTITAFRET